MAVLGLLSTVACVEGKPASECARAQDCANQAAPDECRVATCVDGVCGSMPGEDGVPCQWACGGETLYSAAGVCEAGTCRTEGSSGESSVVCANGSCSIPGCDPALGCTTQLDVEKCADTSGSWLFTGLASGPPKIGQGTFSAGSVMQLNSDMSFTVVDPFVYGAEIESPESGRWSMDSDNSGRLAILDDDIDLQFATAATFASGDPEEHLGILLGARHDPELTTAQLAGKWRFVALLSNADKGTALLVNADIELDEVGQGVADSYPSRIVPAPEGEAQDLDHLLVTVDPEDGRLTLRGTGPGGPGESKLDYTWPGAPAGAGPALVLLAPRNEEGKTVGLALLVRVPKPDPGPTALSGDYELLEIRASPTEAALVVWSVLTGDHTLKSTSFSGVEEVRTATGPIGPEYAVGGTLEYTAPGRATMTYMQDAAVAFRMLVGESAAPASIIVGHHEPPSGRGDAPPRPVSLRIWLRLIQ